MRLYELVYILDPALEEAAVDATLSRLHGTATRSDGAEVVAVDHWGVRQLAYPIDGHKAGYYVVAHVRTDPSDLPEFERLVRLDDTVLRYLLVLNEGEPTSGMSIVAERPPRPDAEDEEPEDDDEDDDDDDDDDDSPPEFQGGQGRRRRHEGPAIELLNFKDVGTISRFLTEQGKILPRRTTRVTAAFQRQLGTAVKRARYLALIPYMRDHEG